MQSSKSSSKSLRNAQLIGNTVSISDPIVHIPRLSHRRLARVPACCEDIVRRFRWSECQMLHQAQTQATIAAGDQNRFHCASHTSLVLSPTRCEITARRRGMAHTLLRGVTTRGGVSFPSARRGATQLDGWRHVHYDRESQVDYHGDTGGVHAARVISVRARQVDRVASTCAVRQMRQRFRLWQNRHGLPVQWVSRRNETEIRVTLRNRDNSAFSIIMQNPPVSCARRLEWRYKELDV